MQQSLFDFGAIGSLDSDTPALACGEEPQQRMEHFGVGAMSDGELLAMMLQGNGVRAKDALDVARRLMAEAGSLTALAGWQPADFRRVKNIGRIKGCQLSAVAEIGRRMMRGPAEALPMLDRPERIAAHMAPLVCGLLVEKFWVLCLNRKNRLIKRVEVTSGTATAALAHPREVFRAALRESSAAIACVHNQHSPSGTRNNRALESWFWFEFHSGPILIFEPTRGSSADSGGNSGRNACILIAHCRRCPRRRAKCTPVPNRRLAGEPSLLG